MSRLCLACTSPHRDAINAALLQHAEGYDAMAARFGLSYSGLRRHERDHLAPHVRSYKELAMIASSESLLAELNRLHEYVNGVLERGEASGDDRLILSGVAQGVRDVEVLSRIGPLSEIEQHIRELEALYKEAHK